MFMEGTISLVGGKGYSADYKRIAQIRRRLSLPEPQFENLAGPQPRFVSVSDTMAMRVFVRAYITGLKAKGLNVTSDSMDIQPHPTLKLVTTFDVRRPAQGRERQSVEVGHLSLYTDTPKGIKAGNWVLRIDVMPEIRSLAIDNISPAITKAAERKSFKLPVLMSDGEFFFCDFQPLPPIEQALPIPGASPSSK
jgi:hypothetical protein